MHFSMAKLCIKVAAREASWVTWLAYLVILGLGPTQNQYGYLVTACPLTSLRVLLARKQRENAINSKSLSAISVRRWWPQAHETRSGPVRSDPAQQAEQAEPAQVLGLTIQRRQHVSNAVCSRLKCAKKDLPLTMAEAVHLQDSRAYLLIVLAFYCIPRASCPSCTSPRLRLPRLPAKWQTNRCKYSPNVAYAQFLPNPASGCLYVSVYTYLSSTNIWWQPGERRRSVDTTICCCWFNSTFAEWNFHLAMTNERRSGRTPWRQPPITLMGISIRHVSPRSEFIRDGADFWEIQEVLQISA